MDGTLVDAEGRSWDSTDGDGYSLGASYTRFLTESFSLNFEVKKQKTLPPEAAKKKTLPLEAAKKNNSARPKLPTSPLRI